MVAVMGCAVNGPGEAKEADVGVAGRGEDVLVFRGGDVIGRMASSSAAEVLVTAIDSLS